MSPSPGNAKRLEVFGYSDDNIEVEGAVHEEFGAYSRDDQEFLVVVSDGTVLALKYGDKGIWNIRLVATGKGSKVSIATALDTDDENTDRATIEAQDAIRWVVFGHKIVASK